MTLEAGCGQCGKSTKSNSVCPRLQHETWSAWRASMLLVATAFCRLVCHLLEALFKA